MSCIIKSQTGRIEFDAAVLYKLEHTTEDDLLRWELSLSLALEAAGLVWTLNHREKRPEHDLVAQSSWDGAHADARLIMFATIANTEARRKIFQTRIAYEALDLISDFCHRP